MVQSWLFLFENVLCLVPLLHTCITTISLYTSQSQHMLSEELPCLITSWVLLFSPLFMYLLHKLQYYYFVKYNQTGHPWCMMLSSRREIQVKLKIPKDTSWSPEQVVAKLMKGREQVIREVKISKVKEELEWLVTTPPEVDFDKLKASLAECQIQPEELLRQELVSGGASYDAAASTWTTVMGPQVGRTWSYLTNHPDDPGYQGNLPPVRPLCWEGWWDQQATHCCHCCRLSKEAQLGHKEEDHVYQYRGKNRRQSCVVYISLLFDKTLNDVRKTFMRI